MTLWASDLQPGQHSQLNCDVFLTKVYLFVLFFTWPAVELEWIDEIRMVIVGHMSLKSTFRAENTAQKFFIPKTLW